MPNNIYDRDCYSCQQLEAEISELRAQNQILREELAQYQRVAPRGDDFHGITGARELTIDSTDAFGHPIKMSGFWHD